MRYCAERLGIRRFAIAGCDAAATHTLLRVRNRKRSAARQSPVSLEPSAQVASMFASIFSGTLIGLGFAVVLTYQQVACGFREDARWWGDTCEQGLFTELPFVFLFPTGLYPPFSCCIIFSLLNRFPLSHRPNLQLLLRHLHELCRQRRGCCHALAQHHGPQHIGNAQRLATSLVCVLVHLRCGSKCALPFLSENIECVSIRNIVRGGGNKCAALILCIEEVPAGCSGLEV